MKKIGIVLFLISIVYTSCTINYSLTGGQFSGAKTFSVDLFKTQTALANPIYAQRLTESLKDLLLSQSPLKLAESDGELQYEGFVTDYNIAPVAIQDNETASLSRLSISIKVKYTNTLEPALSFDRSFTKFADYPAASDLLSVEEGLWKEINDQLLQEIYNSSVGNW